MVRGASFCSYEDPAQAQFWVWCFSLKRREERPCIFGKCGKRLPRATERESTDATFREFSFEMDSYLKIYPEISCRRATVQRKPCVRRRRGRRQAKFEDALPQACKITDRNGVESDVTVLK